MTDKYVLRIYRRYGDTRYIYETFEYDDLDVLREKLKSRIDKNYDREILYGNSLVGPHRDDFIFNLDGKNLLLYGSQGQLKLAIIALKLAEIDVFYEVCGEYPVLLLDDLFSELDVSKRNRIIKYLNRNIQIFVTTTDLNNIDKEFLKNAQVYKIKSGCLIKNTRRK